MHVYQWFTNDRYWSISFISILSEHRQPLAHWSPTTFYPIGILQVSSQGSLEQAEPRRPTANYNVIEYFEYMVELLPASYLYDSHISEYVSPPVYQSKNLGTLGRVP